MEKCTSHADTSWKQFCRFETSIYFFIIIVKETYVVSCWKTSDYYINDCSKDTYRTIYKSGVPPVCVSIVNAKPDGKIILFHNNNRLSHLLKQNNFLREEWYICTYYKFAITYFALRLIFLMKSVVPSSLCFKAMSSRLPG